MGDLLIGREAHEGMEGALQPQEDPDGARRHLSANGIALLVQRFEPVEDLAPLISVPKNITTRRRSRDKI